MLRKAAVETKREFVEVSLQMRGRDSTLVGTSQPALEQGYNEMDMVELTTRRFTAGGEDIRSVIKSGGFELVVDRQPVGDNRCARFDIVPDKRLDGILVNRREAAKTNPPKLSLGSPFYSNKNQCLPFCSTSPCAFFLSTHIGFVHLYSARQMFSASANHDASKLLQPAPSGLVAPETVGVAKILGTQPCFSEPSSAT